MDEIASKFQLSVANTKKLRLNTADLILCAENSLLVPTLLENSCRIT